MSHFPSHLSALYNNRPLSWKRVFRFQPFGTCRICFTLTRSLVFIPGTLDCCWLLGNKHQVFVFFIPLFFVKVRCIVHTKWAAILQSENQNCRCALWPLEVIVSKHAISAASQCFFFNVLLIIHKQLFWFCYIRSRDGSSFHHLSDQIKKHVGMRCNCGWNRLSKPEEYRRISAESHWWLLEQQTPPRSKSTSGNVGSQGNKTKHL